MRALNSCIRVMSHNQYDDCCKGGKDQRLWEDKGRYLAQRAMRRNGGFPRERNHTLTPGRKGKS